ncbi:MAG TPA: NADPH:quinone reductase [Acidimicrobiales bacterium]|nr:NADPH:quinone reductase [Acidimicrobiales bacterium]
MRAAVYRRTGGSDVLSVEEIDVPAPGPGEVRVRVALSGVNPTDWKSRSGATGGQPDGFQVPHQDGSGVIDAVGEGVSQDRVGQRVWMFLAAARNRYGTAAEYCVLPAGRAIPLPGNASDELGASLGVPALTAAHCLGCVGGGPGSLEGAAVLVAGGAGAVGHFAVQLAKQAGARVATTVSSEDKARLAREAGADLVVNYREDGAAEALRTFSPRFARIVEVALGANLDLDLALSGPGTVIVNYAAEAANPVLPTRKLMNANVTLHFVLLYGVPAQELEAAVGWVEGALVAGALTELPVHRYPLDEIAAAQEAVEANVVGKVLVVPG